jgi:hypothetical protein
MRELTDARGLGRRSTESATIGPPCRVARQRERDAENANGPEQLVLEAVQAPQEIAIRK